MTSISIEDVRSLGAFSTLYKFEIIFAKFPSVDHPSAEAMNIRCLSSELPKSPVQMIEQVIHGHSIAQAGMVTATGTLNLTFIESVGSEISNFMWAWKQGVTNIMTGISGDINSMEAVILLHRLDRQDKPIYQYKLVATLEDFDPGGTLDGSSNDFLKPGMTLRYAYHEDSPM